MKKQEDMLTVQEKEEKEVGEAAEDKLVKRVVGKKTEDTGYKKMKSFKRL